MTALLLATLTVSPPDAVAQVREAPTWTPVTLDDRMLLSIYQIDDPVFAATMTAADLAAYPLFYGSVPAAWAGAFLLRHEADFTDAYLLTLSFGASYLVSTYAKDVLRRPRPTLADIDERGRGHSRDAQENLRYRYSLPSGHAAIAFALVTSYGFSHPEWYVLAPGYTWAAATALSRVWRGRHYPTDVVAGALLGVVIGGALHYAGSHITP